MANISRKKFFSDHRCACDEVLQSLLALLALGDVSPNCLQFGHTTGGVKKHAVSPVLPPDTPVGFEDFVLVLASPNARVLNERFNVFENGWTHRLWNQLQELHADKLFACFPKIPAVSIIDKRERRVRQVAADKFCFRSMRNVSKFWIGIQIPPFRIL